MGPKQAKLGSKWTKKAPNGALNRLKMAAVGSNRPKIGSKCPEYQRNRPKMGQNRLQKHRKKRVLCEVCGRTDGLTFLQPYSGRTSATPEQL